MKVFKYFPASIFFCRFCFQLRFGRSSNSFIALMEKLNLPMPEN